jgi:hypothetical protein
MLMSRRPEPPLPAPFHIHELSRTSARPGAVVFPRDTDAPALTEPRQAGKIGVIERDLVAAIGS